MHLSPDILARVNRVWEYHQQSKLAFGAARQPAANRLSIWRSFDHLPKVSLPTKLMDAPASLTSVMEAGVEAIPDSQHRPPHDLRTLATWLYLAYGRRDARDPASGAIRSTRVTSSDGDAYPCELYVASFRMSDLPPGLYHFSAQDFTLGTMREGDDVLRHMKRGRPDLNFLQEAPAAILVSSLYCRASAVHGRRGYRSALRDAGAVMQTLHTCATALGMPALVRMKPHEQSMRELIGLPIDASYADAESVQGMVAWVDQAIAGSKPAPVDRPIEMETIPRLNDGKEPAAFGSIVAVHHDCVAPGVPGRDVRPPMTELSPLSADFEAIDLRSVSEEAPESTSVRNVLVRAHPKTFNRQSISRDAFLTLNRHAFRGGSFYPIFPDGPHVGLARGFWIVLDVSGVDEGVWFCHPVKDAFHRLKRGEFRAESVYLSRATDAFADASAVCVLTANVHKLTHTIGPDLYRLCHLEAGAVSERLTLLARSLGLATISQLDCFDDELKKFLGLGQTGWEILGLNAIGAPSL